MRHALAIALIGVSCAAHATTFYQSETIPVSSLAIRYPEPWFAIIQGDALIQPTTLITGDQINITATFSTPVTIMGQPPFLQAGWIPVSPASGYDIAWTAGALNAAGDTIYGLTETLYYWGEIAGVDPYRFAGALPFTITSIPEPGAWVLMLGGIGCLAARLRHRQLLKFG